MGFPKRDHDPQAVLDYVVDWSAWLVNGDIATDITVTADEGVTIDHVDPPVDGVAVAWISGGTAGESYTVTYHITTAAGREDDRSMVLVCKQR